MNRRELLAVTGATALFGCWRSSLRESDGKRPGDSRPRWLSDVPLDGWTMRRGDHRRTGRAPNASLSLSDTPQVRWETTVAEHDVGDIVATEYGVVTGTGADTSTVLFRRNPTKEHRVRAGGPRGSEPVIGDGVLYFGGSRLTAVNVVADRVEWSTSMAPMPGDKSETPVPVRGTPVVDANAVYAVGMLSREGVSLFRLDGSDGSLEWNRPLSDRHLDVDYEPVLRDDLLVAVVPDPGTDTLQAVAVDRTKGTERWRQSLPIPGGYDAISRESFTPVAAGEHVVFRSGETIHAVDLRTGTVEWEYRSDHGNVIGPVAADDECVYAATREGQVLALDRRTGEHDWVASIAGQCREPVAVGDEHVVAVGQRETGDAKGIHSPATVAAIEKATGSPRWTFEHEGTARAPVIGDGSVFVAFWTVRHGAWSTVAALG
ncbi:PQQ-like beta-propeller repeat protein [Natronobacterium lacisalsi]|nr:PQQ-like beta-propeller repeat protein [Halobiforma lacisalsi]